MHADSGIYGGQPGAWPNAVHHNNLVTMPQLTANFTCKLVDINMVLFANNDLQW